jgi:hypothetical protein
MSGGYFDYLQFRLSDMEDEIEKLINSNKDESLNEWGDLNGRFFSHETIEEFRKGLSYIRKARIYATRIDWLVSGDDSEDCFHKRLKTDIENPKS